MSEVITNCRKCGSRCLWYKPDGSVFYMVCKTHYNKEETKNAGSDQQKNPRTDRQA
jgi:hypothetical protein